MNRRQRWLIGAGAVAATGAIAVTGSHAPTVMTTAMATLNVV